MSAFEFTPSGVRELRPGDGAAGGIVPAAQVVADLRERVAQQEATRTQPKTQLKYDISTVKADPAPIKRRQFVKELRARLRVVERQIKSLRELEDEAAEIKRLIAAAKAPPAKVTDITTARKSG